MKLYETWLPMDTSNNMSNSTGSMWKHIFGHKGWVEILLRKKENGRNH